MTPDSNLVFGIYNPALSWYYISLLQEKEKKFYCVIRAVTAQIKKKYV